MDESERGIPRRALLTRASGVALGAAVAWSAPSVRTTALGVGAAGTPAPTDPQSAAASAHSAAASAVDPEATGAADASRGTLPLTGIDPKPLLIAGGGAVIAGSALIEIARNAERSSQETSS